MDYKTILRMKRFLKPFHKHNLFNRMLEATNGDILVVFNNYTGNYEVHSVRSHMLTADSQNAVFRQAEMLNGYLITDFMSRRLQKFSIDIQSEHMKLNALYDKHGDKTHTDVSLDIAIKSVERALGRKV